jgi:hypothetical protein
MDKVLIILRGLPGSGNSSFANLMWPSAVICEADEFFYDEDGIYRFDASKLGWVHKSCQQKVEDMMFDNYDNPESFKQIVVSNTSTTEKELQPYLDLASRFGYSVVSLIVENRHGGLNEHGVPSDKLDQMRNRFNVKL